MAQPEVALIHAWIPGDLRVFAEQHEQEVALLVEKLRDF
jgi:hypothetical protein